MRRTELTRLFCRFIPQRDDSANLHASYQLIPDGPGAGLGYVMGGLRSDVGASAAAASERAKKRGAHGEIDAMKGTLFESKGSSETDAIIAG